MEACPNCGTQVADTAARCPTCGLPRDLPIYAADGTVLGHTFTNITTPPTGSLPPGWLPPGSLPPGAPPFGSIPPSQSPRGRRPRTVLLLVSVLVGALALGIVAALLARVVITREGTTAGPPASPTAGLPSASRPPSATPTSPQSTGPPTTAPPPPSPTPTPTPTSPRTPEADPKELLSTVSSGVVAVIASTCSPAPWSGNGTGVLLAEDQVLTSWTAVAHAVSVAVAGPDGNPVPAEVTRSDAELGLAVLTTSRPIDGHRFGLSRDLPAADGTLFAPGQQWYGLTADLLGGRAPSLELAELGDTAEATLGEQAITNAWATNLPAKGTPAGGPLLDDHGRIAGLLARYPNSDKLLAIDAAAIAALRDGAGTTKVRSCDTPLGPQGELPILEGSHKLLERYFAAINAGDYETAWKQLASQDRDGLEGSAAGWNSTYDFNLRISKVGGGKVRVDFDSIFAPGKGPEPTLSCARWALIYTFDDGKIARAVKAEDDLYRPC